MSYTVNKPIGDSPKKVAGKTRGRFSSPRLSRAVNSKSKLASSTHNTLVTVNKAGVSSSDGKADIDLVRLAEIPSFVPIMQVVPNQNTSDPFRINTFFSLLLTNLFKPIFLDFSTNNNNLGTVQPIRTLFLDRS